MKISKSFSAFISIPLFLLCSFYSPSQGDAGVSAGEDKSLEQTKPPKKRTMSDWKREQDSIYQAERKLPLNLMRMGPFLRGLIKKMKDAGITRGNAAGRNVSKRFSGDDMSVDSLGRIGLAAQFKNLDIAKLNRWLEWGVAVGSVTYPKGKLNPEVIAKLKSIGANVESIRSRSVSVSCRVPFDLVEEFAKDTSMLQMQSLFPKPIHNVGMVTSKGDTVLNAWSTRDLFYLNGTGVKVGVISDGAISWTSDTANSSDLPNSFQKLGDPNHPGNEGTAIAEIVHDLAPGATIAFSSDGDYKDTMKNRVQLLKDNGCRIIVDDIEFNYEEPMFEDGDLAQKVESVVANGAVYVSAAGNEGTLVYDGVYNPDGNGFHQFYGDVQDSLVVPESARFVAALQWAEAFDQSDEDYTFGVYYHNYQSLPGLIGTNNIQGVNSFRPQEFLEWTNLTGDSQVVHFQIGRNFSTEPPNHLKMDIQMANARVLQFRSDIGGVIGHTASDSCISVAAANASTPYTVASYSSHGNTQIATYNSQGDEIAESLRPTPTLTGVDGVKTNMGRLHLFPDPFRGTSAAAPHIAGVAALMLSVNPNLTPAQIRNILKSTAVSVTGWGGAGLVDAYQALLKSPRAVTDTTFESNATINNYTHFYGTSTVNNNVKVTIAAGKTVIFEGSVILGTNSKISGKGTLILKNLQPNQGEIISERYTGQLVIDKTPYHPQIEPKDQPLTLQSVQALNSKISVFGALILQPNSIDTLASGQSVIVDSGGVFNLMASSQFTISNTCSLRVKGGGTVSIPSTAQITCNGTIIVDQGGTVQVGKGGILNIQSTGQMQLLAGGNGSVTIDSSGQLLCTGNITASDTIYAKKYGILQIQAGGQLTLNSGGAVVLDTSAQYTNYGTTTINSGGIIDTRKLSVVLTQSGGTTRVNQGGLLKIWGDATSNSATIDCYGTLSSNGAITCDGSFIIRSGGTLRADSSSVVKLGYNVWLSVYGSVIAKGTRTKKALFTSLSSSPSPGIWNRIYLLGGPDTLRNCAIHYGIHDLYLYNSGTDIIDSCTIDSSQYYGIYIDTDNGTNTISNSTISGNASGMMISNSKANIVSTAIKSNNGHGIFVSSSKPYISYSRIQSNSGNAVFVTGSTAMPFFSPDGIAGGYNTLKLNTYPQLRNYDGNAYLGELTSYKQCVCPGSVPMSAKGIETGGCVFPCYLQDVYVIHAGYNNIYTSSSTSGMLVTNNTATTIKARYNYWYSPGTSSITGPVDTTSRLSDSVFTPARTIPITTDNGEYAGLQGTASGPKGPVSLYENPTPAVDSSSILAWLGSLKQTLETNPDTAALALHLLSAFVGPGCAYEAALDTPWEAYLSRIEQVTPSRTLKPLVGAYRVQAKMDRHRFGEAIAIADAELSAASLPPSIWLFYKVQEVSAYLGLRRRSDALAISQQIHARSPSQVDPVITGMVDKLISNHPNDGLPDSSSLIISPGGISPPSLSKLPSNYSLDQNYPNPFNPTTNIRYSLAEASQVSLRVFNLLGQNLSTLVDEFQDKGSRSVSFDGNTLPSGVYFYRLQAGNFVDVKKMLLMR
jgi:hypothetical protein